MPFAALKNLIWFLDGLVTVRLSSSDGHDGISILEHLLPPGSSAPLHLHRTEDEIFHILDGELRMRIGDRDQRATPGDIVLAPKGIPHTYRIQSSHPIRLLTITARGDFERFIRAMGRPAQRPELPPPAGPPSPQQIATLTATAAKFGIEIIGPPLE